MVVRALTGQALEAALPRLGELLIDAVDGGAGVGFLAPLDAADALAYWRGVAAAVEVGRRVVLVAGEEEVLGTVQLDTDTLPNSPHRATISKLIVHTSARGRGIGAAMMAAAEREALARGRWLLTLDTATPAAERLYARMGWRVSGPVPDYAMNPDGSLTATTFYWKRLRAPDHQSGG